MYQSKTGLLPISYDSAENPFDDAGHSAFLVAVAYRLSDLGLLKNEEEHIKIADGLRVKVYETLNKETGW